MTQWAILLSLLTMSSAKKFVLDILQLRNPFSFKEGRQAVAHRGMSGWYDFLDWVGGYPYEAAKPEEIFDFYKKHGFNLEFLKTGGLGCNEFVFTRNELSDGDRIR